MRLVLTKPRLFSGSTNIYPSTGYFFSSTASSKRISFKDIENNKLGLSFELDVTMREGHHDMKVFGLGFLWSVSTKQHQAHILASLLAPYSVMEASLYKAMENGSNPKLKRFWKKIGKDVEKAWALKHDVASLGGNDLPLTAAARYVSAIQKAASNRYQNDPSSEGDLLLAHMYVRYLADLFGGSMLGKPTELALGLPINSLKFYSPNQGPHEEIIKHNKIQFVEMFYNELNKCGEEMTADRREEIVEEAKNAFKLNADIYTEREALLSGALKGGFSLIHGYIKNYST